MLNLFKTNKLTKVKSYLGYNLFSQSLLILIILWLSSIFVFGLVRVSGNSMQPSLKNGQILLLNHLSIYAAKLGLLSFKTNTVVIFKPPPKFQEKPFIKRIVALPNDEVSIINSELFVNGLRVDLQDEHINSLNFPKVLVQNGEIIALEGYGLANLPDYLQATLDMLEPVPLDIIKRSKTELVSFTASIKLLPNYYFVLGDNRSYQASEDSAIFGPVHLNSIIGTLLF